MDVTPLVNQGTPIIQSYGDHGFRINQIRYEGAVFIQKNSVTSFQIKEVSSLITDDILGHLTQKISIFLLGTGERMIALSSQVRKELQEKGIVVEVMDSGAASRTFNILLIEDRDVAALIYPVP